MTIHTDNFKQLLNVGDFVVHTSMGHWAVGYRLGVVVDFPTPKRVLVRWLAGQSEWDKPQLLAPHTLLRLDTALTLARMAATATKDKQ